MDCIGSGNHARRSGRRRPDDMETITQKSLAGWLDRAAQRCEIVDREPATGKQCWFLARLIVEADDQGEIDNAILNTSFVLTKKTASRMIDGYLN
jgi:hypothetical protein